MRRPVSVLLLVVMAAFGCRSQPKAEVTPVAPTAPPVDVGSTTDVATDVGTAELTRQGDEMFEIGLDETATSRNGIALTWIGRRHKHGTKGSIGFRKIATPDGEVEFSVRGGDRLWAEGRTVDTSWRIDGVDYDTLRVTFLADAPEPLTEDEAAALADERAPEAARTAPHTGWSTSNGVLHRTFRNRDTDLIARVHVGLYSHAVVIETPESEE